MSVLDAIHEVRLACYLAKYGHITSEAQVMIEQGYAQERPGHIEVRVFGAGVTVAEGTMQL